MVAMHLLSQYFSYIQGRIQDLKLGGAHLKKLRRAEGGENIFGVFRVNNHDLTPKNHIFFNFSGGARRVRPPLDPPLISWWSVLLEEKGVPVENHRSAASH